MYDLLAASLTTALLWSLARGWSISEFFHDRYWDEGVRYNSEDEANGIWDDEDLYNNPPHGNGTEPKLWGCYTPLINGTYVLVCDGDDIDVQKQDKWTILHGKNFTNPFTQTLAIYNCPNLETIHHETFDRLTELTYLFIQRTILKRIPNLKATKVEVVNLNGNALDVDTNNYRGWKLPPTITHLSLANNSIRWMPDGFLTGPNLRLVSLSHNLLREVRSSWFGDVSSLVYLGLDGNLIRTLSVNSLTSLWGQENFRHINVSHNVLTNVQPGTFNNMPKLQVIELHNNHLATIPPGLFHDLPELLHLDYHKNHIEILTSRSLVNLPRLMELRLHDQWPGMTAIYHDAWSGINQRLRSIFIGSNQLTSFPHQVFEDEVYPNLWEIDASANRIANFTSYGAEHFPEGQKFMQQRREPTFIPFSTLPSMQKLELSDNLITHIGNTDLCAMPKLSYLGLWWNYMESRNIDDDAFACLPVLKQLQFGENWLEYIPKAFSSAEIMPAMNWLDLNYNKITYIAKGQLSNIATLAYLSLVHNDVITIENGAFPPSITELYIEENYFRFTHELPFANLPNMWSLNLRGNRITYLPLNSFENDTALEEVLLSRNFIPEIRKQHFEGLPNLEDVGLDKNDLGWVEDGTLANQAYMEHVSFAYGTLARIPEGGTFNDIRVLVHINLMWNWITVLPTGIFKNLETRRLLLQGNPIFSIEPFAFSNVFANEVRMHKLYRLRTIYPNSFTGLNVDKFELTDGRLTTIPSRAFVNFNGTVLDLSNHWISVIEPGAFTNISTNVLNLRSNFIFEIAHPIIVGVSDIWSMLLFIDNNNLTRIVRNAFGPVLISGFTAANNRLRDIPRVVLTNQLRVLWLGNNELSVVPKAALRGLHSLVDLRLNDNNIERLEPGVFEDLISTKFLTLANNPLRTLPPGLFYRMYTLGALAMQNTSMTHLHGLNNSRLTTLRVEGNPLGTMDHRALSGLRRARQITLDQLNGSLECTCSLFTTVDEVILRQFFPANVSGTCGHAESARGVVLGPHQGLNKLYRFMFVSPTWFRCSADNVTGRVVSSTEISVSWHLPKQAYYDRWSSVKAPLLNRITGQVNYTVTCTTPYAPDLIGSVETFIPVFGRKGVAKNKKATEQSIGNATDETITTDSNLGTESTTMAMDTTTDEMTTTTDSNLETESTTMTFDTTTEEMTTADPSELTTIAAPTEDAANTSTITGTTNSTNTTKLDNTTAAIKAGNFSVTFNATAGVRPGTTYECSVILDNNGNVSARSPAVLLSTPDDIVEYWIPTNTPTVTPLPDLPIDNSTNTTDSTNTTLTDIPTDNSTNSTVADTEPDANITGIELGIVYHDFNTTLADFDNIAYIPYTNVSYVPSVYGGWLASSDSDTPMPNSFSSWFIDEPGVNIEFNETLFLREISPRKYRFWSDEFFPLDGRGFRSEDQRDCMATYRNFGCVKRNRYSEANVYFTSVIRSSHVFTGEGRITVAGGEGVWVFIDKVKVVEYTAIGDTTPMPCFVVDLKSANTNTGGFVEVASGILSNGTCTLLISASTQVVVDLEIGFTYHIDLYHAETKTCSSEFLLVLENITIHQNTRTTLPLDYTVFVEEDAEIGDGIAAIDLAYIYGGELFDVTLYSGNEDDRFTFNDTEPPARNKTIWNPQFSNVTDMDGNVYYFVECPRNETFNGTANSTTEFTPIVTTETATLPPTSMLLETTTNVPTTNVTNSNVTTNSSANDVTTSIPLYVDIFSGEEFIIEGTKMYIIVTGLLDADAVGDYYLQMTVANMQSNTSGFLAIRIKVVDINDNCPEMTTVEKFIPQPTLQKDPIMILDCVDIDSGRNADIRYIVSAITADPPIEYDPKLRLYAEIYLGFTTLMLDVVVIDNGTIPRGTRTPFNVTLSNSCVLDVEYEKIEYTFVFNDTSNELSLRIPKYYMLAYDCDELAGLSTGHVPDDWISASSTHHYHRTSAVRGRLREQPILVGNLAGGWVAGVADTNQYLQVDMNKPYIFKKVHIQGRADADMWVTSFLVWYDAGKNDWRKYMYNSSDGNETLVGNSDRDTIVTTELEPIILAQRIRVNPQTWYGNISLRVDFSGCFQAEQLYYHASCIRCETTYYCPGDGERLMCGRCVDNSTVVNNSTADNSTTNNITTCDRDPKEHSFGLADHCWPCPSGWSCVDGYATPCPLYHYTTCYDNGTCSGECIPCGPGFACNNGTRVVCKPGTYSDGLKKVCTPCKPGTYQDLYAQDSCKPCAPGYISRGFGQIKCARCTLRTYYTTGAECGTCRNATECPCLDQNTCFDKQLCLNTGLGAHKCLPCPVGYTGDGRTCTDIDECYEYDPCYNSRCINTNPGYQCFECPEGYAGTYEDAYSWARHRRVFLYSNRELSPIPKQICTDVDECAIYNGGCNDHRVCENKDGSFACGYCQTGYISWWEGSGLDVLDPGREGFGCMWADMAAAGNYSCSPHASAVYLGPGWYKCQCNPGYAGNGDLCGLDTDMDGIPDKSLPCRDWGCAWDNCPLVPNSQQQDPDGDHLGNACDVDDDDDEFPDHMDNCPTMHNPDQANADGDDYGDVCDTCPDVADGNQKDTDHDGLGDICDDNDDNDAFTDEHDNCPMVANADQADWDGDGVGDVCDNCPRVENSDQLDDKYNGYGNPCDEFWHDELDYDGDAVLNHDDNCLDVMNSQQRDTDGDGIGDACEEDLDDDGIDDLSDNCPMRPNPQQEDADRDDVGDVCETDSDGDGVNDDVDTCPKNVEISTTSFEDHMVFDHLLDSKDPRPTYEVHGDEIVQTTNVPGAHMLIGRQMYEDMEYQGTWYVGNQSAEDFIGFVFGYRDYSEFYTVMWRRTHKNYHGPEYRGFGGIKGIHIKAMDVFNPDTKADYNYVFWHSMRKLAWHPISLWHDPELTSWEPGVGYRWYLTFRPTIGQIHLKVYQGPRLLADSGTLYHTFMTGGRVGVLQWGPFQMTWSRLQVTCLDNSNVALRMRSDAYVQLDDIATLQMQASFTVEVWLKLERNYTDGPYPIFCTADSDVCLWVESGYIHGRYGNYTTSTRSDAPVIDTPVNGTFVNGTLFNETLVEDVIGDDMLVEDTWYNVMMRYSLAAMDLSLYIDGLRKGYIDNVPLINWNTTDASQTRMMIGRNDTHFFRGVLDEFRLYNLSITNKYIPKHAFLDSTRRQVRMRYSILHFPMEGTANHTSLVNSGLLRSPTATLHGGTLIPSTQKTAQHKLIYPHRSFERHPWWYSEGAGQYYFRLYNLSITNKYIPKHAFLDSTRRQVRMRYSILHFPMEGTANHTSLVNSGLLRSPTATIHGGTLIPSTQKTAQHKLIYPHRSFERHPWWYSEGAGQYYVDYFINGPTANMQID